MVWPCKHANSALRESQDQRQSWLQWLECHLHIDLIKHKEIYSYSINNQQGESKLET